MSRTLADRLRRFEQQKARLAEQEARLKEAERRQRTRRLIELGGLVEKAALHDLDPDALYGALLSLREHAGDSAQVAQWRALGERAIAREAQPHGAEGKEPLVIVLADAAVPSKRGTAALRRAGFRWNRVMRHWEGLAVYGDAQALAAAQGGAVRRVVSGSDDPTSGTLD